MSLRIKPDMPSVPLAYARAGEVNKESDYIQASRFSDTFLVLENQKCMPLKNRDGISGFQNRILSFFGCGTTHAFFCFFLCQRQKRTPSQWAKRRDDFSPEGSRDHPSLFKVPSLSSRSPGLPRPEGSKPLLSPSGKDQEEEEEEEERERERESFIRNNLHNGVVSGAEEEEEEEEGLFKADAVNEEDPERDRDLSLIV